MAAKLADEAVFYKGDLDIKEARILLDVASSANGLPRLDEKRFTLLFSRFACGSVLVYPQSRAFLYTAFRKLYKYTRIDETAILIQRYFFVLKGFRVNRCYRFKAVIGQGSFGVVHRVVHITSGLTRVCKSVKKSNSSVPIRQLEAEIRIIARLDHPNVVRMLEFYEDDDDIHLILEYCSGGDLLTRIKNSIRTQVPLDPGFVSHVIQQVLIAVAFMSQNRVVHKDLKPENIMLVENKGKSSTRPVVKVIDFGLSEVFGASQDSSSTVAGTAFYMAPEIFRPPFTDKCDVWSCGIVAFFMLTGFLPFFGATVGEVKSYVLYRRLQWPTEFAGGNKRLAIPDEAKDLVEKLLEKDPKLRPTAAEALKHSWLNPASIRGHAFSPAVARNMHEFSKLSVLKRAMINLIAHIWEFEESDNIRSVFSELDQANLGYIPVAQLANSLELVGLGGVDAWKTAKSLDITASGVVSYTSLVAGVILPLLDSNRKIAQTAFQTFSPNAKGRISGVMIWQVFSGHRCAVATNGSSLNSTEFVHVLREEFRPHESRSPLKDASIANSSDLRGSPELEIDFPTFRSWLLNSSNRHIA